MSKDPSLKKSSGKAKKNKCFKCPAWDGKCYGHALFAAKSKPWKIMPSMKTKQLIQLRKEMNQAASRGDLDKVEEIKKRIKSISEKAKGKSAGNMSKRKSMIG